MEKQSLQPTRDKVAVADAAVDGEEDEEEMQMEAFFALVRNFKEMRDRRRKEVMIDNQAAAATATTVEKKRKTAETVQRPSTWIPRFVREDFDEDFQVRGPPLVLPKPVNLINQSTAAATAATAKKMRSEGDFLDLNLTL